MAEEAPHHPMKLPTEGSHETPLSLAEVTALLTAPGQMFEMETVTIWGVPTRIGRTHRQRFARSELALHGDADFLVYEDERLDLSQHFQQVAAGRAGPA